MIRIDALWLCSQPQDMRAGADRLLAVVVNTLGEAQAHHGYVFANARAEQTTFSIPITGCRDRVPVASAAR
jgi:transposase